MTKEKTYRTDRRAALFLADGCEEIEALTVSDLLYRAGVPCTLISVMGRREITSSHGIVITAETMIEDVNMEDYDMLILPGGIPGTPNLAACAPLTKAVTSFAGRESEGKAVAAICAAPSILANLGLLDGKQATCNPCVDDVLKDHGAIHLEVPVVKDGNLITSRSMGTAIDFGLQIVEFFLGKEAADHLSAGILHTRTSLA